MNRYNNIHILVYTFLLTIILFSCKHGEDEYHSITDKIEAKSKNYHGTPISSEPYLEGLKTVKITEGAHTFLIPERKSEIKSYACTECHTKSLSELKSTNDKKKAHWDIKLAHADLNTMNCITCHNGNNMDSLVSLTGVNIDFNRSYKLCSQCHSKQFKDWKGGAHGKKLGGWAPPRASMTCVNCHNPHKPGFETRLPAGYNTQKVKERE